MEPEYEELGLIESKADVFLTALIEPAALSASMVDARRAITGKARALMSDGIRIKPEAEAIWPTHFTAEESAAEIRMTLYAANPLA